MVTRYDAGTSGRQVGRLGELRRRWFGEQDEAEKRLRALERQGEHMAHVAHGAAYVMFGLMALATLVTISADTLAAAIRDWQASHTVNVIPLLAVLVTVVMVACFDITMTIAAILRRNLIRRGATAGETWKHTGMIYFVGAVEGITFGYMLFHYDPTFGAVTGFLMVCRAIGAPLVSVYLATVEPQPVQPRDFFYQASVASGRGMLHDIAVISSDPGAPLDTKVAIYGASSNVTPAEEGRIGKLIAAVRSNDTAYHQLYGERAAALPAPATPPTPEPEPAPAPAPTPEPEPPAPPTPPTPPQGPARERTGAASTSRGQRGRVLQLQAPPEWRDGERTARADSGRTRAEQQALWERDSDMAAAILASEPGISTRELARRLSVGRETGVYPQRADKIRRTLQPERGRTAPPIAVGSTNVVNVHAARRPARRRVPSGPAEASA